MNIHAFVKRFSEQSSTAGDPPDGQRAWTDHIRQILHNVCASFDFYCCCEGEHTEEVGRKREYLWDLTWYSRAGQELDLPVVVIEHENEHSHRAFFADFWKVMTAFAPVRIMVGYTSASGLDDRVERIHQVVSEQGWSFPPGSTDVLILKAFGPSEATFLVRYPGERSFAKYQRPPSWDEIIAPRARVQ
jgi:hypothetical protein